MNTISGHNLYNLGINSFGNTNSSDSLPVFLPDNVVNIDPFVGPTIPFLTIFAFGPMILFFVLRPKQTAINSIRVHHTYLCP